jgi:hypothetical protein
MNDKRTATMRAILIALSCAPTLNAMNLLWGRFISVWNDAPYEYQVPSDHLTSSMLEVYFNSKHFARGTGWNILAVRNDIAEMLELEMLDAYTNLNVE